MNIQPIEKQKYGSSDDIEVHSIFYTIQGEGPYTGHPAIFIRLAGCNLQCPGCDTDYTSERKLMSVRDIEKILEDKKPEKFKNRKPVVVITGGEPFRQNIAPMVRTLASKGYTVQIETNGTLFVEDIPWNSITIVCSPKTGKINPKLLPHIDAFKYVMASHSVDENDGLPILALEHTASPKLSRPPEDNTKPIYLQPMDARNPEKNLANLQACIKSCMVYGYILQLQIHKLINME